MPAERTCQPLAFCLTIRPLLTGRGHSCPEHAILSMVLTPHSSLGQIGDVPRRALPVLRKVLSSGQHEQMDVPRTLLEDESRELEQVPALPEQNRRAENK
jgi:hypothetical protein